MKWIYSLLAVCAIGSAENIVDKAAFGDTNSNIKVYLFTDWFCQACRILETDLKEMMPQIMEKATVYFIDFPIHKDTLNYSPYNLAFMVNNKEEYFKLRDALSKLTETVENPTDKEIKKAIESSGVSLQKLSSSETYEGIQNFLTLAQKFMVRQTPTMVIINEESGDQTKLIGYRKIKKQEILEAIDRMQ